MKISKSYKYLLHLSKDQAIQCARYAGCCRKVWNVSLKRKIELWENEKTNISAFDLNNKLISLKTELPYLKEAPSQALQQVNKDLDQAFKNFFRRCKNGEKPGFPKFKKKGVSDAFRLPQGVELKAQYSKRIGAVKLPKLGITKFIKSKEIEGRIRNATISKNSGNWFIAFNCELEIKAPAPGTVNPIGIDRGVKSFGVCSDGKVMESVSPLKKNLKRLAKLQRRLKNKKRFSKNWNKIKNKINKLHSYVSNVRKDYLHKQSTMLANNHGLVVLEKLKTSNMSRSAKGTLEEPGRMVKQKSGLNRVILDQGWHMFKVMLDYKLSWSAGHLIEVNPKYTSQGCNRCGHIHKENRPSQSKFVCLNCGHEEHADLNAAKNILAEGLLASACGGAPNREPAKQEARHAKSNSFV